MKVFDAERALGGGGNKSREINEVRNSVEKSFFQKGVVVEFISKQATLSENTIISLVERGADEERLRGSPPNTAVVLPIDKGDAHTVKKLIVCYPFFSHLFLPIKPGETIWFTTGKPDLPVATDGAWWLSRVVTNNSTEDSNYTHHDRQFWDRDETGYPNGAGSEGSYTIPGGIDAFEKLVEESVSVNNFVPQASHRFIGSPNATGLIGSHRNCLRLDVFNGHGISELVAGLPKPEGRLTERNWEERDPTTQGNDLQPNPEAIKSVAARFLCAEELNSVEGLMDLPEIEFVEGFGGVNPKTSAGGVSVVWADDTVVIEAGDVTRVSASDSSLVFQEGQLATKSDNLFFDAERAVLLRNAEKTLFIGGEEADEPLVLGAALQSWQEGMIEVLNNVLDALNSAVIPSPVGPLPLAAATTSTGTVASDIALAKQALQGLQDDIPKHLSSMANINGSSKAD